MRVICIDDRESSFFRKLLGCALLKDPRLTKGKVYETEQMHTEYYGNAYVPVPVTAFLIICDTGIPQWFLSDKLEPTPAETKEGENGTP